MEPERIELSAKERERLKVLHEVEQGHLKQVEAARRLRLTDRHVRRLQARLRAAGDGAMVHGLRGRGSNRKIPEIWAQRALRVLRQARYAGFGPTLAAEHLARQGLSVSRETLRKWMSAAGLWQSRRRKLWQVHVWLPTHGVIGSHRARHPHAENFLQALGTLQGPMGIARHSGWHGKALLPVGPEGHLQKAVGLLQSGDLLETHFVHQPVLQGAEQPLDAPFGLRRVRRDPLDPQFRDRK